MALNPYNFSQSWSSAPEERHFDSFKAHENMVKSRYLEQNAQQDLMTKELANIFQKLTNKQEPERHNVTMGHTRAQTRLSGAHAAELEATNPFAGRKARANADILSQAAQLGGAINPIVLEALKNFRQPQQQEMQGQMPGQAPASAPLGQQNLQDPRAQFNKMMQDPLLGQLIAKKLGISPPSNHLTGHAADINSLNRLINDPSVPEEFKQQAKDLVAMDLASKKSNVESKDILNRFRAFNSLPAAAKENLLAGYRALGLDELEAQEKIAERKTPGQVALEMGYTKEEAEQLDKQFAPTSSTIADIQKARGAAAEEDVLSKKTNEALAPYAQRFFGYSPKQIKDAFSNEPGKVDKMAKFYAARALQPEIAGIRARMAGASNAHEALKEIQQDALNKFKVFEGELSPEAYKKAQEYIGEWLQEATQERTRVMSGQKPNAQKTNIQIGKKEEKMVLVRNHKTGETKLVTPEEAEALTGKKQ